MNYLYMGTKHLLELVDTFTNSAMEVTLPKLEALEARLEALELKVGLLTPSEWVSPAKAGAILGTTQEALIKKIKHSLVFPEKSPYREGTHFRVQKSTPVTLETRVQVRYQINVKEWKNV
jgi:hypothetical protein